LGVDEVGEKPHGVFLHRFGAFPDQVVGDRAVVAFCFRFHNYILFHKFIAVRGRGRSPALRRGSARASGSPSTRGRDDGRIRFRLGNSNTRWRTRFHAQAALAGRNRKSRCLRQRLRKSRRSAGRRCARRSWDVREQRARYFAESNRGILRAQMLRPSATRNSSSMLVVIASVPRPTSTPRFANSTTFAMPTALFRFDCGL